jgi:hypothetical protein
MTVIQAKQEQPIWKSRTVLAAAVSVLAVLLTSLVVNSIESLKGQEQTIFTILFSVAGAIIAKYLMTDFMGMLADIVSIIFADGELNLKDITNIIGELLLDDNGLNPEQVETFKAKMVEHNYIVKENGGG